MTVIQDTSKIVDIKLKHWSNSQDQSFRKCRLKWYRSTVLGLMPKKISDPLYRGLSVHYALQQFHSLDVLNRTLDALLGHFTDYYNSRLIVAAATGDTDEQSSLTDWRDNIGVPTMSQIWRTYNRDADIPKLSFTEYEDEVPIPGCDIPYKFRLDALVLNDTKPFIFETKTMSRDNRYLFDMHDLQAARNIWAINQALKPQQPIRKVVYNFVVFPTTSRDGILSRQVYEPSDAEILWAVHDLPEVVSEATRPSMVIYPNFTSMCKSTCEYYQLCLDAKLGMDIEPQISENYYIKSETTGSEITGEETDS